MTKEKYKHKEIIETGNNIASDIEALIEENDIPLHWIFGSPGIYTRKINLTRMLAQYEIFKLIKDVPGSIVECGVFQGAGLLFYAKLVEIFCQGDRWKKVYGFDTFDGFLDINEEDISLSTKDQTVYTQVEKGGYSSKSFFPILNRLIDLHHKESFTPGFERIKLYPGDVKDTLPKFVEECGGERISLLILDMDLYMPTKLALEHLYDLVTPGGIVVLDEYSHKRWPGEVKAFDEYFSSAKPKLKKFNWSSTPGAYFIKN